MLEGIIHFNRYTREVVTESRYSYFWTREHRRFVYSEEVI